MAEVVVTGNAPSAASITAAQAAAQAVWAAQAAWFIDGKNATGKASDANDGKTALTPLLTDRQRQIRMGSAPVTTAVTITLLSSASSGDYLMPPLIGPGGYVLFTGTPGATAVHAGTLTAAAAQSGNSQGTVTDTALPTSWTASGLLACRLRITSGARAGAITSIANDLGSKTAGVGDPETFATAYPPPLAGTTVALSTNPYVAEYLPEWLIAENQGQAAQFNYAGNANTMLCFEGIAFSDTARTGGTATYSEAVIGKWGTDNSVLFVGCYMGGITGTFTAIACCWEDTGLHCYAGSAIYMTGCVVLGDANSYYGSALYPSQGTIFVGGGSGVSVDGAFVTAAGSGVGIIGSESVGLLINPPGRAWIVGALWGSGNATYGCVVHPGGTVTFSSTTPTLTGTSGNIVVGGTATTWAALATTGVTTKGANAYPFV